MTEPTAFEQPPQPPEGSRPFAPGELLNERYRIVLTLGKGGMGEVYRADDLVLGVPVALKFLARAFAQDPDRLARFRQEVALARQIAHPRCCRVYDIGEYNGRPFLSMEYIDGEDLAHLLQRVGRLQEEKGLAIARDLCQALQAVHEQGLLHRDLKPANVMLDGKGLVRLTDFGLAILAEQGTSGSRAGTPAYMAPEQLAGKEVTARTDLFALGLVLYEVFTGKRAYEGVNRATPPVRPSSLVSGLRDEVEGVILRCLDPDPASRPASTAEVLRQLPGGDPLETAFADEPPSPQLIADAPVQGTLRPWIAFTLALTALLLGSLSAWSARRTNSPTAPPTSSRTSATATCRARIKPPATWRICATTTGSAR